MDLVKAVADQAAMQLAVYPVITGKEKVKRLIRGSILRQKQAPVDPFSWPNAMLGEGLLAAFEATGDKKYLCAVINHLKRWKSAAFSFHYVDNAMNGWLALWISELLAPEETPGSGAHKGADGSAASFFSAEEKREILALCRETAEACAAWLDRAAKTKQGILPYRQHHPDWLFADTLGMVCPFLCRYGAHKGRESFQQLGVQMLQQFIRCGMDESSGLPYHGYDENSHVKYGIIGWGRACGWMMKGLAESLPYLSKQEEYVQLKTAWVKLAAAAANWQRTDGGFSWQLSALEGAADSSAGGMIGTALIQLPVSMETGNPVPLSTAEAVNLERLCAALQQRITGGIVEGCSGECVGFAQYPQIYGSYPWGTGSVLEFLARYSQE